MNSAFLYRKHSGMSGDDVLAGVNWNKKLIGRECDPFELRTEIENEMDNDLLTKYESRYDELVNNV